MHRIRLALGRRPRHRFRPAYREQPTAELPGDPIVCVSQTPSNTLAGNATNHGMPSASLSDDLVALNSHAIFSASAAPAESLPSMSNAGEHMDFISHSMSGTLADNARNSGMPIMSNSGKLASTVFSPAGFSSACVFVGDPFSGTMFPTLAGARRILGMPVVPNIGDSIVCVQAMYGTLADNATNHGMPSASHSGCSVALNSHAIFVASADPAESMPSMNAGMPVMLDSGKLARTLFSPAGSSSACVFSMSGTLADNARNSGLPVMLDSGKLASTVFSPAGSSSACVFVGGPSLGTMFPTLTRARKNPRMPGVRNTCKIPVMRTYLVLQSL